jgi:hypothetical protein
MPGIPLQKQMLGNYTFLTPALPRLRPNDYAVTHELVVMGFSNSTFRSTEYKYVDIFSHYACPKAGPYRREKRRVKRDWG